MEKFGFTVLAIILPVILGIYRGFVFMKIWNWFLIPLFGVHGIGLVYGIALSLAITFLTYHYIPNEKETDYLLVDGSITSFLVTSITLLYAWILTLCL